MKKTLSFFLFFIAVRALALDPSHFTITRITAPYFIVDGNSPATITKAYVGFEVKNNSNSGVTYNNLKFTITSIATSVAGQNYSVISPASGITNAGTLAPGESKVCYFYVSYPANVTPQATFNVTLSDNTGTSKTQSFVIRNRSSISANAGGAATQTFSNQDLIGGLVTDDVTYAVGNVQNGDENDFQVAVSSQFDPAKITLLGTQVISSTVPGIPAGTTDSLYFISGNGSNGATVTIRWTFRITSYNFTTYLLPCAGATSGSTNYKYALNTNLGSGSPVTISSSANPLTITKTSDNPLYIVNSPSVFTITISNPGAYGITIDKIVDQLPAGFVFQSIDATSQVKATNSTTVPQAGATGVISFEGGVTAGSNLSYYVPAGGSYILKYNATTSTSSASGLQTTVQDYIGATLASSAQNTVSVSTILPMRLVSFKAESNDAGVTLSWVTSSEINTRKFEIQRSTADGQFITIGEMIAAGSSDHSISYSFTDKEAPAEKNYYRLKMIDMDDKFEYSNIASVLFTRKDLSLESVYPNPFTDYTNVTLSLNKDSRVLFQLYDMNGKIVFTDNLFCKKGTGRIALNNLDKLSAGNYILKVISPEVTVTQKILKAR